MTEVRASFLEAVAASRPVLAAPAVADRWAAPSALAAPSVGALAAHLARAVGLVAAVGPTRV